MADEDMEDGSSPLSNPPSSSNLSIMTDLSDLSDPEEQLPDINFDAIITEVRKIPATFGIHTAKRVVKLQKHIRKSDKKFKKMSTKLSNIMTAVIKTQQQLDTLAQRMDTLISNLDRDRNIDKAKNYNEHTKLYNGHLRGDDARLHNLLIVESNNIEEIGIPIPNAPIQIQDIKNLSLVAAEEILRYLGFQNFDDLRADAHNRANVRSQTQQEVRRQYGLA